MGGKNNLWSSVVNDEFVVLPLSEELEGRHSHPDPSTIGSEHPLPRLTCLGLETRTRANSFGTWWQTDSLGVCAIYGKSGRKSPGGETTLSELFDCDEIVCHQSCSIVLGYGEPVGQCSSSCSMIEVSKAGHKVGLISYPPALFM